MIFPIVALLDGSDLFFGSRIQEVGKTLGVPVILSSPAHGLEICEVEKPKLVLVDLGASYGVDVVRDLRSVPETRKIRIIGFYPHVDSDLRDQAVEAGVDEAIPQSAFTVRLGKIIGSVLG